MHYCKEEQRLNQWWVLAILLFLNLIIIGFFVRLGHTMMDSYLALTLIFMINLLIIAGLSALVVRARLETQIDQRGIRYRYMPFIRSWRNIDFQDLSKLYLRKYTPFRYGGWGYFRDGKDNVILNARGNMGIQLVFKNGKRLLIGTQKAEEIQKLLDKMPHQNRHLHHV